MARILLAGVLAVVAVLVISAILVAAAPYVAAGLVVMGAFWLLSPKEDPSPPGRQLTKYDSGE